jgi:hypothetical protein
MGMANTDHPEPLPLNADEIQRSLLDALIRAAELNAEWELLREEIASNEGLPRSKRLAMDLVAICAKDRCRRIADHVVNGLSLLDCGLLAGAWQARSECQPDLDFNEDADRTLELIVRSSHPDNQHGN